MTPEERMREAAIAANKELAWREGATRVDPYAIIKHGAAAIEAALAEQRELFAAWIGILADDCQKTADAYDGDAELTRRVRYLRLMAQRVRDDAPRTWAERTGWQMEETLK